MADPQPPALVVGLDGASPSERTRGLVARLTRTLRDLLHPDFRVPVLGGPIVDGAAFLEGLKPWKEATRGGWLVGVGRVQADVEDDDDLALCTSERLGLSVEKVRKRIATAAVPWRVVVLDLPEEHAKALRGLDWGACAVLAIGPGLAEKLEAALLIARKGEVRADEVARAVGGRCDTVGITLNRRLADAPKADPHAEALAAYLAGLKAESDKLVFDRATREAGNRCTLGQVYVPLFTQGEGADDHRQERDPDRKTAHDRLAHHRCVFLVGEPGSGKTSFLRRVAATLCEAAREGRTEPGLPADPLPIFFELARFKGEPEAGALLHQATSALPLAGLRDCLPMAGVSAALATRRLVLLLDGLDEVPAEGTTDARARRRQMARALTSLANVQAGQVKVVVTCRPAAAHDGASLGLPFRRYDLQPLQDPQVLQVAANWLRGRPATADQAEPLARQLVADLHTHPAVRELAGNPLTLAMICVVLYQRGRLPRDRNDLYSELIDLLLQNRERGEDTDKAPQRRVWLTDLAWFWWKRGGTQQAESTLSEEVFAQALRDRLPLDAALKEVRFFDERAGLLVWRSGTERGYRLLRFAHRSFVEYLVACRLTEDADQTELQTHALDANWREVALMYVAEHARKPTGDKEPAWRFVRHLLDRAEDPEEPWTVRGPAARLAAQCLADWRDEPAAQVEPALGQRLDKIQDFFLDHQVSQEIAFATRVKFWTALGPHNRVVREQSRWVDLPAATSWLGAAPGDDQAEDDEQPARAVRLSGFRIHRWPVTVAEFGNFVAAGGYAEADLWSPEGWSGRQQEGWEAPRRWPRPGELNHPITDVSWFEAEAFCAWLTRQMRGWRAQLPTEAQWEYAARGAWREGGRVARYPWGWDDDPDCRASVDSWPNGPVPPGAFPRGIGPTGTWDLSGNVWEWCRDGWAPRLAEGSNDPWRSAEPGKRRVLRGGAFLLDPLWLRVSCRGSSFPQWRSADVGFRCVCVPAEEP